MEMALIISSGNSSNTQWEYSSTSYVSLNPVWSNPQPTDLSFLARQSHSYIGSK
jgi:hypothetical protein